MSTAVLENTNQELSDLIDANLSELREIGLDVVDLPPARRAHQTLVEVEQDILAALLRESEHARARGR